MTEMHILIFFIICFVGIAVAVPFIARSAIRRSKAKAKARQILDAGHIDKPKEFAWVSEALAKTPNDLEATDLWKRLQNLKAES